MGRGDSPAPDQARREAEGMFAGGNAAPAKRSPQYVGIVFTQSPAAIDEFVRAAPAGAEFVYCEAPEPQRTAEGWLRAGELEREGLVRIFSRRRAGGGWQYYATRTGKGLPRALSAAERALADRATRIIFDQLKREANFGGPCSSDQALSDRAGLGSRQRASQKVRRLIDAGLIHSELVYVAGVPARVVTILKGKFAGAAAEKSTALPRRRSA